MRAGVRGGVGVGARVGVGGSAWSGVGLGSGFESRSGLGVGLACFEMPWKVLFLAILSAFLIIFGSRRPTRAGDCERAMLAESRLVIERSRGTWRVEGGGIGAKAATWVTLEAARWSTRGSGGAPSGPASSWECRAAHSLQTRPEEAQAPSSGPA